MTRHGESCRIAVKETNMKTSPLRLLLAALVSVILVAATMAVPASARSNSQWRGYGWSGAPSYQTAHYRGYRAKSNRRRSYSRRRYNRRRHHNDDLAIVLGLGVLGAILATPHYHDHGPTYRRPVSRGWCHVHQYRVRGMTFHREVRCFKHRNWRHDSILYVR